jgi:hypothetical protein
VNKIKTPPDFTSTRQKQEAFVLKRAEAMLGRSPKEFELALMLALLPMSPSFTKAFFVPDETDTDNPFLPPASE